MVIICNEFFFSVLHVLEKFAMATIPLAFVLLGKITLGKGNSYSALRLYNLLKRLLLPCWNDSM